MINDELKEYIKREIAQATQIPVGAIFAFPSEKIPEGFLPCEGQELSRTQYPKLFELIGKSFGRGKTFCLPDLQGQFLRGLDRQGNLDIQEDGNMRSIGDLQQDALQGHRHKSHEKSNGGHDHKVYVRKNQISYGTNTFSSDNTADLRVPTTPSDYEALKIYNALDFVGASVETTHTGSHTHGFAVLGVTNDTYGEIRISSETRPKNMALIFCIKAR